MSTVTWSLQHKRDTAANFTSNNPVLLAGQLGIETDGLTTTPKFKIGDGVTAWTGLPYFYGGASSAQNLNNVLGVGNSTGGANLVVTDDDIIQVGSTPNRKIGFNTSAIAGGLELVNLNSNDHIILQDAGGIHIDTTYIQVPQVTASRILATDASNKITGAYTTTGSGTVLALSTSPTFVTDITTPLIIGGSAVGSTIQYKGTSGNGTSTVAAHQFLVGNNGATTAASIYNSGQVNIGNYATPSAQRLVTIGQDTAFMSLGSWVGLTGNPAIYMGQATPDSTNYVLATSGASTYLNAPTNGTVNIAVASSNKFSINNAGVTFTFTAQTSGAITNYNLGIGAHTGQTASTEIPNFKVTGNTKTWAAGAITTQRWNYLTANTAAFASASTIAESFGLYVEAATIGSNATITNNFGLGVLAGTATIKIGHLTGTTTSWALYGNQSTPSATNPFLYGTNNDTFLNAGVSAGRIYTQVGGNTIFTLGSDRFIATGIAQSSGAITNFTFTVPNNTGQTTSAEIPGFVYNSYTRTWAAGAITTQREHYIKTVTYAFASASTITNAYAMYIEAATLGANATITNNYALGLSGSIVLATNNTALYGIDTIGTRRVLIDFTSGDNININGRAGTTDININPTSGGVGLIVKGNTGDTGLGAATPSARCHIIKTTEQLRVGYDASNYAAHTVGAAGSLTIGLTGTTPEMYFNNTGGVVIGNKAALATTATDGFLYVPSCAGLPTGVPTAKTGKIAVVVDSTNNKMYIYSGGAWVALN